MLATNEKDDAEECTQRKREKCIDTNGVIQTFVFWGTSKLFYMEATRLLFFEFFRLIFCIILRNISTLLRLPASLFISSYISLKLPPGLRTPR